MRRAGAERGARWGAAVARAAGKGIALGAALLAAEDAAAAEVVRYVDREGKVHEVIVRAEAPAGEAVASRAEAAEAAAAAPPAAPPGWAWGAGGAAAEFPYAAYVREAAALYSLPVELILAVMKVESGFNPKAVSRSGAMGLMQLMPGTAAEVGVRDPFDARQNVLGGARYLRIMINAHDGSVPLALAAYHAGAGTVERYAGVPPYPETRRYVERVRDLYRWYKERGIAGRRAGTPGERYDASPRKTRSA
ncbi:lytic transglycosylase domain-containing protein [Sorangium cellulosum]|uniref:lytic transglycosylase domain-containing protein n=1 Tax=Sorangium cellulosum TaxID=56 RepID=UPI001A91525F|nr:lytic transglycosylase domain-containing protein [Sorangium cellulosum]